MCIADIIHDSALIEKFLHALPQVKHQAGWVILASIQLSTHGQLWHLALRRPADTGMTDVSVMVHSHRLRTDTASAAQAPEQARLTQQAAASNQADVKVQTIVLLRV